MSASPIASAAFGLYRAFGFLAAPLIARHMEKRKARGKEDSERFGERFGQAGQARPNGNLVWIHGSSVGESVSALPLISRLREERPDLAILVTTGTVTSAQMMAELLPDSVIHQFAPIDTPNAVRGFFNHWQPQLGLMIESEFWPNLLLEAKRRKLPLHLINGRMSPKSFKGWKRSGPVFRALLESFEGIQAQSPEDQHHFQALGFEACSMPGNLKFAAPALTADPTLLEQFQANLGERPRWLLYSSHPGEEILAAQAHRLIAPAHPGLLTMIVPRHPERGPDLAEELRAQDMNVAQRSTREPLNPETEIYLADTLGELGVWFRLNRIAMMGGTLIPKGGQNPIEAARLGCALLCGPHTGNFVRIVEDMIATGAVKRIRERPGDLGVAVGKLLKNPDKYDEMSAAARAFADTQGEVLDRIVAQLNPAFDRLRQS
ncbi:3-deoxy-D-manno-octulosonic acid transferase [Pelagibius sp. Alg239-R121]|uniref:3-deoxy-D-manno-octulosonic acid transferase n=1 Tax=Pelagibius sp. Alg239-R121 TaxID=2993448 RepID=UPI0024A7520B|nr:3-deoxy-D-manno-octulosonic acid transferase [Pelagibius sp. Alg239-R121]